MAVKMQYEGAVKTLERKGFKVTRTVRESFLNPGQTYEYGCVGRNDRGYLIEVTRNGGDCHDRVATIRVRRESDRDQIEADYFAGSYVRNLRQAIDCANRW